MEGLDRQQCGTELVNEKGISRRGFFKLAGVAAGGMAALSLPRSALAVSQKVSFQGAVNWQRVQNLFIIDPRVVYMNIGTTGSMPRRVLENYIKYNRLTAYHPKTYEDELGVTFDFEAQRATLANQFGCNPDEICISRNTTDGLDAVIYGLQFESGDEILITHHEHIASLSPLNVRQDRDGLVVTQVEIPVVDLEPDNTDNTDLFINAFEAAFKPNKTKAILFSHITYKTGTRLPAKELCQWARDKGIISIVDGAHAPGMIELDFHDLGCDFYAGPGHKWQCGPGATGILYLRNQGDNLPTFWTQNSSLYTIFVQPVGVNRNVSNPYDIGQSLQYRGQANVPAMLAMMDSCALWEQIGRANIETYVCGLSSYLKKKIKAKFGSQGTLFAPDIPEFTSGLTSFNPFDDITDSNALETFVNRLQDEYGFQIRYTDFLLHLDDTKETYAARISTHLFHDYRQVDRLVEAMYALYQDMA